MKQAAKLFAFMLTAFIALGSARADFIKAEVIQKTGNQEEAVCYQVNYDNYGIDASKAEYAEIIFSTDTSYADGCIGYEKQDEWVAELYELTEGIHHIKTSSIQGSEYLQVQIWNVDPRDTGEGTVSIEQILFYDVYDSVIATIGDSQIELSRSAAVTTPAETTQSDPQSIQDNVTDANLTDENPSDPQFQQNESKGGTQDETQSQQQETSSQAKGKGSTQGKDAGSDQTEGIESTQDKDAGLDQTFTMLPKTGILASEYFYVTGVLVLIIGVAVFFYGNKKNYQKAD